ncbi:MAG: signal peptide peptidase SppA [Candidatus Kapabacteria bacterium]|nr:signal peptide peptidase SppA [Candidatus Kapabacteria bacterium]
MTNTQTPLTPEPYYSRRRSRWWIPVLIIGVIFLGFIILIYSFLSSIDSFFAKEPVEVKSNTVLYLNFKSEIEEVGKTDPFATLFTMSKGESFHDILRAIRIAKQDDRIKGIYFKATPIDLGYAKTMELMEALDDFKQSGKFIYAYFEAGTENHYMRLLPADKIFMPEDGFAEMNGFAITQLFLKGLFAKLGIEFFVDHFEDFKSAGESLNRTSFSDSSKLQLRVILNQRHKQFVESVAKYRKLDKQTVENLLARGVFTADSMKALGLIDEFATEQQVRDKVRDLAFADVKDEKSKKLRLVSTSNYLWSDLPEKLTKVKEDAPTIAIIYGSGAIMPESSNSPFDNENVITPKEFVKNLRKAREDKKVKAIILRIDSPGGSVIASDAIWQEIIDTKKEKPVYASMSDVAASGGYYISVPCDTIIAHPMTITGSIGVISAIPIVSDMLKKLDITLDSINTSPSAQDLNVLYPFSKEQREKFHQRVEGIYHRFINKVSSGRNKTFDQVRAIAKGRVWTGEDAYKIGLVDTLGGIRTAINIAKRRLGVPENELVKIKEYPRPTDSFEKLIKSLMGTEDNDESIIRSSLIQKLFGVEKSFTNQFYQSLPDFMKKQVAYFFNLFSIAKNEQVMIALPYSIEIK